MVGKYSGKRVMAQAQRAGDHHPAAGVPDNIHAKIVYTGGWYRA
jgi:hypothetical protein